MSSYFAFQGRARVSWGEGGGKGDGVGVCRAQQSCWQARPYRAYGWSAGSDAARQFMVHAKITASRGSRCLGREATSARRGCRKVCFDREAAGSRCRRQSQQEEAHNETICRQLDNCARLLLTAQMLAGAKDGEDGVRVVGEGLRGVADVAPSRSRTSTLTGPPCSRT
jgi:hypothetical protein